MPSASAIAATARRRQARGGGLRTSLLLLGLALVLAACAASPDGAEGDEAPATGPLPPSMEPIEFPRPDGSGPAAENLRDRRAVDEADAGWAEKHAVAARYADGGFDAEALALVRGALAQDPPAAWRARFLALRQRLEARRIEEHLLRAEARGARDYVVFGEPVDWRIRIRNVSGEPLEIGAAPTAAEGGEAMSPTVLSLTVVRRDVDIYGAELVRRWNRTLPLATATGGTVRIAPREVHEVRMRVPAEDVGEPIRGLRILELEGRLRLSALPVGGARESGTLPVRSGRVVVLPAGYEPLAADPLAGIERAADTVAPTHLLVATEFVGHEEVGAAAERLAQVLATGHPALATSARGALGLLRDRSAGRPVTLLAGPLADALGRHPERGDALMGALAEVTGEALPPDARLWREWVARAGRRGRTLARHPAGGDGP